jgi:predicted O-methyltransferase YrrM
MQKKQEVIVRVLENFILATTMKARIEGPLRLDRGLFDIYLSAPEDPLPGFQGAMPGLKGRGKDHPRYGRLIYSFVRFYRPEAVVEVGTNAGGTAVGIARAIAENKIGRLTCVDNGEGVPRVFPDVARRNIVSAGLAEERLELICADSQVAIPALALRLKGRVGVYLVDAAHTFEAALADMENGLPMVKPGGFILAHDIDPKISLGTEASTEHPYPVLEAFKKVVDDRGFEWCILKFIRKHLGVIKVKG